MANQAKADQIAFHIYTKLFHVLYEARTTDTPRPNPRTDKWFNLETPRAPSASTPAAELNAFRALSSAPPAPSTAFTIQVVLAATPLAGGTALLYVAARTRVEPEPRLVVLEEWALHFAPAPPAASTTASSSGTTDGAAVMLLTMYKDAISLFRALYALLRILPAWRVVRQLAARRAQGHLHVAVRLLEAARERGIGRGRGTDDGGGNQTTLEFGAGTAPLAMSTHVFPGVLHPAGTLTLSATYLAAPAFTLELLEALPSSRFAHAGSSAPMPLYPVGRTPPGVLAINPSKSNTLLPRAPSGSPGHATPPITGIIPMRKRYSSSFSRRYAGAGSRRGSFVEASPEQRDDISSFIKDIDAQLLVSRYRLEQQQQLDTDRDDRSETVRGSSTVAPATGMILGWASTPMLTSEWEVDERLRRLHEEFMRSLVELGRGVPLELSPPPALTGECSSPLGDADGQDAEEIIGRLELDFDEPTAMDEGFQVLRKIYPPPFSPSDATDSTAAAAIFLDGRASSPGGPGLSDPIPCAAQLETSLVTRADVLSYLSSDDPWKLLSTLPPESVCSVAEILQTELKDASLDAAHRHKCFTYLRRFAKHHAQLPPSFFVRDVVKEGIHPLAKGGFADIWKGHIGTQTVCIKVLRTYRNQNFEKAFKDFVHEALVWKQLCHPNVLPFLGINTVTVVDEAQDIVSLWLISPWMPNGNIISFLDVNPRHDRLTSVLQIARGLKYLHDLNPQIIHGDIRGANVLVTADNQCCLADFGLALVTGSQAFSSSSSAAGVKGSIRWLAPEIIFPSKFLDSSDPIPTARDVYSFASTILEIYTGMCPFAEIKHEATVMGQAWEGRHPVRPEGINISDGLWDLLVSCWMPQPIRRASLDDIIHFFSARS